MVFETNDLRWGLFVVHLKSRYSDRPDDPESKRRRVGEARAVRNLILKHFPIPAEALFLIAGDLNDTRASSTIRSVLKRGKTEISIDVPAFNLWKQTWTYHYLEEEVYSRSDYFLASAGMLPRISNGRGMIVESRAAPAASDHRLVFFDLEFAAPLEVKDAIENAENLDGEAPLEASPPDKEGTLSEPLSG